MLRSREAPDLFVAIKKAFENGAEWLKYKAPNDGIDDSYDYGRGSYNVMRKIADYALLPIDFRTNDFFTVLWNGATPDQRQRIQDSKILTKEQVDPGRWDAMFFSQIQAANRTGENKIEFIDGEYYSVFKNIMDYARLPMHDRDEFTILWNEASEKQKLNIAQYLANSKKYDDPYFIVSRDRWTQINRDLTFMPAPPVPFEYWVQAGGRATHQRPGGC
jgi:hypothetical protein